MAEVPNAKPVELATGVDGEAATFADVACVCEGGRPALFGLRYSTIGKASTETAAAAAKESPVPVFKRLPDCHLNFVAGLRMSDISLNHTAGLLASCGNDADDGARNSGRRELRSFARNPRDRIGEQPFQLLT